MSGQAPSAVLFDYGHTLVRYRLPEPALLAMLERFLPELVAHGRDRDPTPNQLLAEVLLASDKNLEPDGLEEIDYPEHVRRHWEAAGYSLPPDLVWRLIDAEQRCWESAVSLAPGALDVIRRIRRLGRRTAIVTNAPFPAEFMVRQMRGNGVADLMDALVFSSEVGRRKPSPVIYQAALDRLGVDPEAALFVGDRELEDYQGPTAIGMRAVITVELTGRRPADPAIPVIASLAEVIDLL